MYVLVTLLISTFVISSYGACSCSNPDWCKPITTGPRKEVFAFHLSDDGRSWQNYDWSIVTTIAVFGDITEDLVCYAHSKGVRVVLGTDFPEASLPDAQKRSAYVTSLVNQITSLNADGVNLDIEGDTQYRDELTALVTEVRAAFNKAIPGSQVTFDTEIYVSSSNPGYDYVALSRQLDFFFIMAYDMCWGTQHAEANCPIAGMKRGIEQYLSLGIPRSSLVLGVPWYGYDFPCNTNSGECKWTVPFGGGSWQRCYNDLMAQADSSRATINYDAASSSVYFDYFKGSQRHQVWFDNTRSLTPKYQAISQYGLRGTGMWYADCLNYSNRTDSQMMWNAMRAAIN